jgi:PPOX class probable F420-dependent enzyme
MPRETWDPSSEFGKRAVALLETEGMIWLTTTDAGGRPQPNPVWFVWDGETVLVYSHHKALRNAHIRRNPQVALNFNSDRLGAEVVIISCTAEIAQSEPPVTRCEPYLEKYGSHIPGIGMDVEGYAEIYSVPIRIRPLTVRGF